jgi:hypothetical protein
MEVLGFPTRIIDLDQNEPGRWRFGEVLVEVLPEADPYYQPALEAGRWLEGLDAFTAAARGPACDRGPPKACGSGRRLEPASPATPQGATW